MRNATLSIFHTARSIRRQPDFSPIDKSRTLFLLGFIFLIALFLGAAIFYIGAHVRVVNLGYKIDQELKRKQELTEENKRLGLEIARLKSPTRIEKEAKEHLDLQIPESRQLVYLSDFALPPLAQPDPPVTKKIAPEKSTDSPKPEQAAAPKDAKIIVAKIIRPTPVETKVSSQAFQPRPSPQETKESIPAALLDSMP